MALACSQWVALQWLCLASWPLGWNECGLCDAGELNEAFVLLGALDEAFGQGDGFGCSACPLPLSLLSSRGTILPCAFGKKGVLSTVYNVGVGF